MYVETAPYSTVSDFESAPCKLNSWVTRSILFIILIQYCLLTAGIILVNGYAIYAINATNEASSDNTNGSGKTFVYVLDAAIVFTWLLNVSSSYTHKGIRKVERSWGRGNQISFWCRPKCASRSENKG